MSIIGLLVAKTAPFAGHWRKFVPPVNLNVLDRVTEAKFIDARAASYITVHLNDRQIVDKFLSIGYVSVNRFLNESKHN